MLDALNHHLFAGKVEHDDLETIFSQDLEGDEVSYLQLVSYGEIIPPLISGKPTIDIPELDSPIAVGVRLQNDFPWDGAHVLTKDIGDRK